MSYRDTVTKKKNAENRTYSQAALEKLARGGYANEKKQTKEVPYVKPQVTSQRVKTTPTTTSTTTSKPSTRYDNPNITKEQPKSTRDTRYDKDFDEFHSYRVGDKIGVMDYDASTDRDVEHWRNLKKDIMTKNNWSEKEFDSKWDAYYKERSQKEANQEVNDAVEFAKKHPVLGTLLQGVYTPQNMIEGGAAMLSNLLPEKYKAQSADDTMFTGTRAKEGIKQAVKDENIKSNIGKIAYDMGTGLGDMAFGAMVPGLGAASLGTQAAARANMQALERGVDPTKAALTGGAAGAISGVMNKVGLDKALGATAKTALGTVGKAATREGLENVVEDIANLAVDSGLNVDKSQIGAMYNYYTSQGMDADTAKGQVAKDIGLDLATSFGSGSLFGGVMSGVRNVPALANELSGLKLNNKGMADVDELGNKIPEIQAILRSEPGLDAEKPKKIRDQLSDADRVSLYGEHRKGKKMQIGLADHIGYAKKFAGDTPEAQQLAKDTKKLLNEFIETGDFDVYDKAAAKAMELNDLAKKNNVEYKGDTYDTYFADYDENGNRGEYTLVDHIVNNEGISNAYKQFHMGKNKTASDGKLSPEETAKLQDVAEGKYDIPENGNLPNSTKIPEYTMGEDVYFNGSDADIAQAEAQDQAIVDTFKNIIADPEFNALSFKNKNKEVFVSPATNGNGLRMSYTIDGVPTGHHDYSLDQLDDLSRNLRNEAGNGGEDIKIQRKSDMAKRPVPELSNGNEPPRRSFFDDLPRTDKEGISKVGTNSAVNAEIFTKDQIDNDPVISELNKYAKANNEVTFNQAKDNVVKNGAELLDDYISGKKAIGNDLDVDQSMLLLKGLTDRINDGETGLEAQRNLLFSKLRQAGTLYGQTIQAFKKWNDTPEGAVINGERLLDKPTKSWKSNNKKKVEINGRIAKALERMGYDGSMDRPKTEKTHEQIKQGVKNVIEREFGSVEKYFNDSDLEFLTTLAENKDIPIWQITDEIEHKMNFGDWYTLDESIEPDRPVNQKLQNALNNLIPRDTVEKEPLTFEQIREQVRNTLDKESASLGEEFDDRDVDYLSNLIQSGATKAELTEALNTKLATGKFGISLDTQQKVNDLFAMANRYDPNSREAVEAKTAAYKLIADEVAPDASPLEKFESWRYLAMLGNPKTMIRNFVGNKMFGAVTGVSNNISAMLEEGTDKLAKALGSDGIQRTKAVLNPVDDRGLIKAAGEDGEAHRYSQLEGTKYEKGTQDAIRKQKSVFNSKLIRLYEQAVDKGVSDYNAVKKKYSTSLAGYMKANGLDESAFDADNTYRGLQDISKRRVLTDDERARMESYKDIHDQLEKARDYAVKQAEYATFHEDNAIAQFLTQQSQKARNSESGAVRGLGYMLEGLVPFKKTPANILRSGVEYSPLGALKSIKETGKLIYENTGSRKGNLDDTYIKKNRLTGKEKEVSKSLAADVLDSWSKTLTGTGLVALGYYLKNKGILNSSNKDEKWQDDLEGIQNYSMTINGKTYTLDWAAPAVMPLLMGAEMSKIKDRNGLLDQKWYDNLDAVGETANALLDPIFETSMLSGIKDTLEQATKQIKYDDNAAIGGILGSMAMNTATGYLTQGIPTISGQIARTVDNTRRTTDTATSSPLLEPFEKQGRKIINKIPGLSMLNQPYYDSYGRTQNNSPTNNPLVNLAYQMGSPAYIRNIETTAADESARNAYNGLDENGKPIMDSKVFPSWKSKVSVGGEKFTPEEMASYRKTSGEANYAIRDALTKEEWFNNLNPSEQTEYLKKVNTLVDKIGKDSVDKLDSSSKELEAYQSGGIPSLLNYWNGDIGGKKAIEETGLSGGTNAVKEIKAAYADGDTKKAEELTEKYKKQNEERLKLNEKYGVNIKMADFTKREEANPGSNEQWAKENATKNKPQTTTQNTSNVTTKSQPQANNTVDTTGYEKQIARAGKQNRKFTNDLPKLKELNYSKSQMYTYAYAINQDSSLTPQSFNTQFRKMDLDNGGSMSQDEMIEYFNRNNTSENQAKYLWKTYGENKGASWKAVPVLKNGTWKRKK